MLVVNTAASDRLLLTDAEIRAAIGVETGEATTVGDLNKRVAAAITRACKVIPGRLASGGAQSIPTLRKEVLTETFRYDVCQSMVILSRSPVVAVTGITVDGTALTMDIAANPPTIPSFIPSPDFEIDGYMLRRLSGGRIIDWSASVVVVNYSAGFETVPEDLKLAASKQAQAYFADSDREPGLRSLELPGVITETYTDKAPDSPGVTEEVMDLLRQGGYVMESII